MTFINAMHQYSLKPIIPNLMSGIFVTLNSIVACLSYATLIFSGDIAVYVPVGVHLLLLSTIVYSIFNTLLGAHPFTSVNVPPMIAVVFALIAANITATLTVSHQEAQILPTLLTAFAITSVLIGIIFFLLGFFKIGNLIRYIPYPVVGGFSAGLGWLIIVMVVKSYFPSDFHLIMLTDFFHRGELWALFAIVLFGLCMFILQRKYSKSLLAYPLLFGSIFLLN